MKPQTYFVKVEASKEPELSGYYFVLLDAHEKQRVSYYNVSEKGRWNYPNVTHWLRETSGYLLTGEELVELLMETYAHGLDQRDFYDFLTSKSIPVTDPETKSGMNRRRVFKLLKPLPMLTKGTLFVFYDSSAFVHWIDNGEETQYPLRTGLAGYLWLLMSEPGMMELIESEDEF